MKDVEKTPNPKNAMETIRVLQKRYCSRAMVIAIAVALLLIAFGYKPLARGLVLGTLFSIINFVLMGHTLQARIDRSRRQAFFALVSLMSRFALMAVPLIIASLYEPYHIVTAIVGLFLVQGVIFLENLKNLLWNKSTATEIGK
jgi:ammonia channel protein AmtB